MAISALEHARLIRDGCLVEVAVECEVCRRPIEPGQAVHCNDGYDRIYGEFVLSEPDGLHEDNWPMVHKRCSCPINVRPRPRHRVAKIPRAMVVAGRDELARLARARLFGAVVLGMVVAVAGGAAAWLGAGAGLGAFAAGLGLSLAAWSIATRLRDGVAGCNESRPELCCKPAESDHHPDRRASC